jgi:anti-anti-sigma regulatory factor
MPATRDQLAEIIIDHLAALASGECSITHSEIEAAASDPTLAQVLAGLLHLHEDLTYHQELKTAAQAESNRLNERLGQQNRELEQQRAAMQELVDELSSVVFAVGPGALLVPLVGRYDRERMATLASNLLNRAVAHRVRHIILDLTGLTTANEHTADQLAGLVRSLRLVGAQVVTAGCPPDIAMILAELGSEVPVHAVVRRVDEALDICLGGRRYPARG